MGAITDLCIAGKNTYYNEMITLAGGMNAYDNNAIAFPMISLEGIYRINPQIVIDMAPDGAERTWTRDMVLAEWRKVGEIDAVKQGRVFLFNQEFAEIPGPGFVTILEQMAKIIHPEIAWN